MEKKEKFGALLSSAKKGAKDLFNTAVQTIDQNDDGKFDFADVSTIAETVGNAVKKGTQSMKDSAEEKTRQLELKTLRPIFSTPVDDAISLIDANFLMPKFIRVTDRDKKHAESAVCQGSIGYASEHKGLYVVNIFRDSIDAFGLTFYPDSYSEFYFVDPSDRDLYIALDEYFNYLKIVRVNELKKIAQDLGAKYFKVTYMEEKTSFSSKIIEATVNAVAVKAEGQHQATTSNFLNLKVEAESHFPGRPPVKPHLKYLSGNPSIQALIAARMDETSPLMHEKFLLKLSASSGIKESDALKIDAVLNGLKCTGNATVTSEVKNESRRLLEYEISF